MKRFLAVATFAGGCFWCMEPPFESLKGVVSVTSGYTGGDVANPTYQQVSDGGTGHYEAVQVRYDPQQITYAQLLEVFWRNIDPTDDGGQFCDRGPQYRAAIFFHDAAQKQAAEQSKKAKKLRVVTEILPARPFYPAEEYHQDYAKKNPVRYKFYRFNCGRDRVLKKVWGN
jgi:peptide-methionine (S)-S-oxide reductase